ncbi:type IV-A pilus assembly ATPase PilB [Acinetobacter beijerinckii]|uniref:type IV-A pilus assembly ATPase PilB n=1 Tax=Acinetobacter beijerinckii TaxID=262668 RepID=UPI003AF56F80
MSGLHTSPKFSGFIRRLVEDGHMTASNMQNAIDAAKKAHQDIVAHLIEHHRLAPLTIAESISVEFGEPLFDLGVYDTALLPRELTDNKLIQKHRVVPLLQRGQILYVATSNPTNIDALDAIRFNTKLNIEAVIVEFNKLDKLIEQQFGDSSSFDFGDSEDFDLDVDIGTEAPAEDDENNTQNEESPIVKYINKLLIDAIRMGASDLHFEPYEKMYRVRYRVDGVLRQIANPPLQMANRLASRLKVMSQMDISEKRMPQDGRIKLKLSKTKAIDFRVNSLPTLFGEKLVLRILDPSSAMLGIEALGYEDEQKALFLEALDKPQGMLLITGPTGSGKTVSLYTGLNILNTEDTNISTAEDPVEINLEGINQVNVNPKTGLTFSAALKAFLRQDPDIIMVGEIRDLETAEIAIKAAQTGHMVMSTLHTNSAPETLTRLRNMGVPSFNIATSVNLVIAQRLARRLCAQCKIPTDIPKQSLLELGFTEQDLADPELKIYQPVGCAECREGYKGRVGIYEVMKVTPEISKIIMEDGNAIEIASASERAGFNNLRRSGLKKVMQGITSLQEVNRVTSE